MDQARPCEGVATKARAVDPALDEQPPVIAVDERRMHVRAYNVWVSLLGGRAYPAIAELDPTSVSDFAPNAVLLDFTAGGDPAIAFLGERLRDECGLGNVVPSIAQVPERSLLSRLTDHYRNILVNRAPIGFEAEFVGQRDTTMLYRGILMPFSSDGDSIDFVYGVISWKALADPVEVERFATAARAALAARTAMPSYGADARVWADGPGGGELDAPTSATLTGRIAVARERARRADEAQTGARAALHEALGLTYDLVVEAEASPAAFAALVTHGDQQSFPHAITALVFGHTIDSDHASELADALAHARAQGIPTGGFARYADGLRGGVRAMIVAERADLQGRRP
jgi:hypothetical protein